MVLTKMLSLCACCLSLALAALSGKEHHKTFVTRESARTTGLDDRRNDQIALDDVERIAFRIARLSPPRGISLLASQADDARILLPILRGFKPFAHTAVRNY